MNSRNCILLGALLGALGVGLGAFGAHGLEEFLRGRAGLPAKTESGESRASPAEQAMDSDADALAAVAKHLANWDTAVRYHLIHACALVLTGILAMHARDSRSLAAAGWLFTLGVALFSGLLYAMVLGGPRWLGAIVPIGGLSLIAGWLAMAIAARRIEEGNPRMAKPTHG